MRRTSVLAFGVSVLAVAFTACTRTPSPGSPTPESMLNGVATVHDGLGCRLLNDGTVVLSNAGETPFQLCLTIPVASHRLPPASGGDILGFATLLRNGVSHAHFAPLALYQIQLRTIRPGESLTFKGDRLPVTYGDGVDSFQVLYRVTDDTLARCLGPRTLAGQRQSTPVWTGKVRSNIIHLKMKALE